MKSNFEKYILVAIIYTFVAMLVVCLVDDLSNGWLVNPVRSTQKYLSNN